ncbi:hypothetical protein AUJ84_02050 [Candidatus Pacearchaeota archaeon CG1_02_32_132]|nr:MAG: hypothetical protein AUJ84_02050 [Candidatus Pacearchaeota archaeon CG1_02_32_132]
MTYDVGLVLAHELNSDKSLSEQTRKRTELGERLFYEGKIKNLIMSGGHGDLGECYGVSLARQMKNHAVLEGIPEENVFEEDISFETVGQLLFSKIGLIDPNKWKNILIISNDYHVPRIRKIAEIVFDDSYNINFAEVESKLKPDSGSMKKETERLQKFIQTFRGVKKGDNHLLLERLLERHDLYAPLSEEFRKRLNALIERNKHS